MEGVFRHDGEYDGLVIAEFPDDKTGARAALGLASGGNVTTETLRAFTLDEFKELVEAMPWGCRIV